MIESSDKQATTLQRLRDIVILFAVGVLFLFAQSASWLNHTIFDKQAFTSTVTPILQGEQSRQAIASTITQKAFAERPLLSQLIGDNVTALISGLLATDTAKQMITTLVDKSYSYLTTDNPQPIAINLVAIKTPLQRITEILEARGRDVSIDANAIPDQIVLFNPSSLPDIYGFSVLVLWLGPLCWIGFILLGILYIYMRRDVYPRRIYILGGVVIVASCIGLLVGPLLPPPLIAQVQATDLRPIVSQIISALLAPFTAQMITAIVIVIIVLTVFALRFQILYGMQWVFKKTADVTSAAKKPAHSKR